MRRIESESAVGRRGCKDWRSVCDVRVHHGVASGSGIGGGRKRRPITVEGQILDRDAVDRITEIALNEFQVIMNASQVRRGGLKRGDIHARAFDDPAAARVPSIFWRNPCLKSTGSEMDVQILGV